MYYISKVSVLQESKYVFRVRSGFNVSDIVVSVTIYSMHWMLGVPRDQSISFVALS